MGGRQSNCRIPTGSRRCPHERTGGRPHDQSKKRTGTGASRNGVKKVFGEGKDQKWTDKDGRELIEAALHYLGYGD